MKTTLSHLILAAVLACPLLYAADGKAGSMSADDFTRMNKEAGEKIMAIEPSAAALSDADVKLMKQIATGGMMQLELSKIAVQKSTNPDVKLFAQAEVDEQVGLGAKLQSIAKIKKIELPDKPDEATEKAVADLKGKSGADLDAAYLQMTGIQGHEKLLVVMTKVKNEAMDDNLLTIAGTALPLIELHLKVAKEDAMNKDQVRVSQ